MALSGLYLLQDVDPAAVGAAPFNVKVVETTDNNGTPFTASQVAIMESGGGTVLGYFSLGEAENYRSYFSTLPSSIIGPVDPDWPGDYQVAYWSQQWLSVAESAIATMVKAGYHGIYFDVVCEYDTSWAKNNAPNGDPAGAMKALVETLSQYAKGLDPNFQVWVNSAGAEELLTDNKYLNSIDGMLEENVFYNSDGSAPNSSADVKYTLQYLNNALAAGKPVIDVEYVTGNATAIADVHAKAAAAGLGSYIGPLDLNYIDYKDNSSGAVIDTTAPTITSVVTNPATAVLHAGQTDTLTVNFSEVVVVDTTSGSPKLSLNDGGLATYAGGSGTNALTFKYTVASGENTPDLTVTGLNLNGATIRDQAGNSAVPNGANTNPAGILQIDTTSPQSDTTAPTITSVVTNPTTAVLHAGQTDTLTVNFSEVVVVDTTSGSPKLSLNDGGLATYAGGSGTNALTFKYTVASGENTPDLTVTGLNLNGATIRDQAGNSAVPNGANTNPAGILQIDTTRPKVTSVVTNPTTAVLHTGKTDTLTVNFSEVVVVDTTSGSPKLSLNDGGFATYTGGSGTNALTFKYTVAPGENTPDLTVTGLNLNGATIRDQAGNSAVLKGANTNPAGILQINGTATQFVNATLLSNYIASASPSSSAGGGGTTVLDQSANEPSPFAQPNHAWRG